MALSHKDRIGSMAEVMDANIRPRLMRPSVVAGRSGQSETRRGHCVGIRLEGDDW